MIERQRPMKPVAIEKVCTGCGRKFRATAFWHTRPPTQTSGWHFYARCSPCRSKAGRAYKLNHAAALLQYNKNQYAKRKAEKARPKHWYNHRQSYNLFRKLRDGGAPVDEARSEAVAFFNRSVPNWNDPTAAHLPSPASAEPALEETLL